MYTTKINKIMELLNDREDSIEPWAYIRGESIEILILVIDRFIEREVKPRNVINIKILPKINWYMEITNGFWSWTWVDYW